MRIEKQGEYLREILDEGHKLAGSSALVNHSKSECEPSQLSPLNNIASSSQRRAKRGNPSLSDCDTFEEPTCHKKVQWEK